jgi:hypothetical protein
VLPLRKKLLTAKNLWTKFENRSVIASPLEEYSNLHPAWLPQHGKVQGKKPWRVLDSVPQIFGRAMAQH